VTFAARFSHRSLTVSALDLSLHGAPLVLVVAACWACCLPARRASRADPLAALRTDRS